MIRSRNRRFSIMPSVHSLEMRLAPATLFIEPMPVLKSDTPAERCTLEEVVHQSPDYTAGIEMLEIPTTEEVNPQLVMKLVEVPVEA